MAKKKQGSQSYAKRSRNARASQEFEVEVSLRPLFAQSEEVVTLARIVLATHAGKPEERERLIGFLKEMSKVQQAMGNACRTLDAANPMYRNFNIRT